MALSMEKWENKVAVVTGASDGIGAAIVEELLKYKITVVGLARREELMVELKTKLEKLPGKFYPCKTDLTKEGDIIKAFKWIKEHVGPIGILINNASAIITKCGLIDGLTEKWEEILNTNTLALCITTREAIKDMKTNKIDGHIVHIIGLSSYKPIYDLRVGFIFATKHAVLALTETLRQELNSLNSKIKISSVSPGLVNTESVQRLSKELISDRINPKNTLHLYPKDVADAVMFIISTPPHVQINELIIRVVGETF